LRYELFIERRAQKQLAKIPEPDRGRIVAAVEGLAEEPRPLGVKKLTGREAWRIRVGDYRIIYEIHDKNLMVLVIALGHRRDIYRS
jgi:mRNA interferase RelE/StbE